MENTIDLQVARALLPLAAEKDIRQYLNGVYVDFQPDKTIYVATNGHMLGVYTEATKNEHTFNVIIPRDVVNMIKPSKKNKHGTLAFDPEANTGRIIYLASSQDLGFKPLEGKYPDYARVIPDKTSGEASQFDAEYIYAFAQVNKALGAKHPGLVKIEHNGDRVALIRLNDAAFVGILAPCRM